MGADAAEQPPGPQIRLLGDRVPEDGEREDPEVHVKGDGDTPVEGEGRWRGVGIGSKRERILHRVAFALTYTL